MPHAESVGRALAEGSSLRCWWCWEFDRASFSSHPFEGVPENLVGELQVDVLPCCRFAVLKYKDVLHAWHLPLGRCQQDVPRSTLPTETFGPMHVQLRWGPYLDQPFLLRGSVAKSRTTVKATVCDPPRRVWTDEIDSSDQSERKPDG